VRAEKEGKSLHMSHVGIFRGRVGLQQRVLPAYRTLFFDRLAAVCEGGLSVFSGAPRHGEAILTTDQLETAQYAKAHNIHILRGPLYMCFQGGLVEWLGAWDPEVLILEANPRYIATRRALAFMHRRDRPVLGWGLGAPPIRGPFAEWRRVARQSFLRNFDALIAYSNLGAEQYLAAGVLPERVFVAHNAVSPAPTKLVERSPLVSRPTRVLFVGRLQKRKRIDLLLRACAAMEKHPDLTIVGDGPARLDMEQLAQKIYPRARFVGMQQGEILKDYFARADLFVLPGTGGLAVQEAMAHGLPVIVAQGDGTQADLVAGDNGWLIPSDNLEALIHTLSEALADPKSLRERGENSYRIVVTRFNINAMVEVFVKTLNTVVGEC
jgi:glycosyltransferase involved in cell wall biosynthesis